MKLPDFNVTPAIEALALEIVEILEVMEKLGDIDTLFKLRKASRIQSIQSSVAIEANTLSLEQVTDIINGRTVAGNPKEILEVKNAWDAYEGIDKYEPYSVASFLEAHQKMSNKLINEAGCFRSVQVGVYKGFELIHDGAKPDEVASLMTAVFEWGQKSNAHPLIKSCVIHFLIEFVHPFEDGNGRMGRLWQTVILSHWKPSFAWVPVETMVYQNQLGYYDALATSGKSNNAAPFVQFMLNIIAYTLGIIVRSKALPRTNYGETVALPYLPDFSQYPKKRDVDSENQDAIPDNDGKIPDNYGEIPDNSSKIPDKDDAIPDNEQKIPDKSFIFTDIIPDLFTDKLSKAEREFLYAVFPYLCEHGEINNYRAQTLTGKSADSVKKYLAKLVSIGFLQAQGEKRGRIYRFADFGDGSMQS